jgi:predicted transcriptional regulator
MNLIELCVNNIIMVILYCKFTIYLHIQNLLKFVMIYANACISTLNP